MHTLDAALLGAVQGLTEFLPISSDGHLIVAAHFLPGRLIGRDALGFDVLLHAGSLLALLLMYARTWRRIIGGMMRGVAEEWRLAGLLILATLPGAFAGLFLEDIIAGQLRSPAAAGWGFLVTAVFLIAGEMVGRRSKNKQTSLSPMRALVLGLSQALAILPGVSRSGLTISTGRFLGFARPSAVDISFLMAVPIIGGAVAKIFLDTLRGQVAFPPLPILLTGFLSSFIVSCVAIALLRLIVRVRSLAWFTVYLIPLGASLVVLSLVG